MTTKPRYQVNRLLRFGDECKSEPTAWFYRHTDAEAYCRMFAVDHMNWKFDYEIIEIRQDTGGPDRDLFYALATAMAVSLYQYNVPPIDRAKRLFEHFEGDCAELHDLLLWADDKHWATVMPAPTAYAFVMQAVEVYGSEAYERTAVNLGARDFRVDPE